MPVFQSQPASRRKLVAAARFGKSRADKSAILPPAFFLTDPKRTPDPASIMARLPRGWGVIYRHFGASDREAVARALAILCKRRGLVFLVTADPQLARQVNADGVHWPMNRLGRIRSRRPGWIETASAHSRADLVRAAQAGIDAALLSSVFASDSASAPPAMGLLRFNALAAASPLPVYALGGIAVTNAARPMTYAAGWAAIGVVVDVWK